jgi:DUF1680 family protein
VAVVEQPFQVGDEVTLTLPLSPRFTLPDPRIDAVRGCVAVERGPLVMCAESVDLPGERHVDLLRVDPSKPPREHEGSVVVAARFLDPPENGWPYREAGAVGPPATTEGGDVPLVPYNRWATRGPSTMRVWLPSS